MHCVTGSLFVDRELLDEMLRQRLQCGASGSLKLTIVSECLSFCKIAQLSEKVKLF
jgi:hypothetical protein